MKLGPRIRTILFETIVTHYAPPFAVASLVRIDPVLFLPTSGIDVSRLIRWTQQQGENRDGFCNRIRADLRRDGIEGEAVFVYERGAAFERRFVPFSPDPAAWAAQFRPAPKPVQKPVKAAA